MSKSAPTYSDFTAAYPQFASIEEPIFSFQLSLSARILSQGAWGDFYGDAVTLDVAHNLSLQMIASSGPLGGFQGAAGPLTSASAAGMSSSFASPDLNGKSATEQWYLKTVYGQQFLRLRNVVCPLAALAA